MPAHRDLTGADLHEPKGASGASANTVYVSNGAGSGAWNKIGINQIDTASLKNANRSQVFLGSLDLGSVMNRYQAFVAPCTVTKILLTTYTDMAGADTILTFRNAAGTSMGTMTVPAAAQEGTVVVFNPAGNNVFAANTRMTISSDGGATNNPFCAIVADITWT